MFILLQICFSQNKVCGNILFKTTKYYILITIRRQQQNVFN